MITRRYKSQIRIKYPDIFATQTTRFYCVINILSIIKNHDIGFYEVYYKKTCKTYISCSVYTT